ncbi:20S-pre-rRNA D-site endonuclease nob1 [Coemansia sp. RSA 2049]|nr:20S-pre-rRNA D-site endonuclease nob1 [Coemansia sp. RSA 2049]
MSAVSTEPRSTPSALAAETASEQPQQQQQQEAAATSTDKTPDASSDGDDGKRVATLVVDTNVLIKGLSLDSLARRFVTIPEVYRELRSKAARDRYEQLDLHRGIRVMEPDAESVDAVYAFARHTGDFAALALADLRVVALAVMLERQANGMANLRLKPSAGCPAAAGSARAEDQQAKESKEEDTVEKEVEKEVENAVVAKMDKLAIAPAAAADEPAEAVLQSAARDEFEVGSEEEAEEEDDDAGGWQVAGRKPRAKPRTKRADNFFNGTWITPANVKRHQMASATGLRDAQAADAESAKPLAVACATSDFAMQNVLLGMGVGLITPDGTRIKALRTWVLRCHACAHTTRSMATQFCPACGHPTLKRCAVSTAPDGRLTVHLRANYKYNLRGTIFSLPQAHGGPHKRSDVITRPDDRAYLRAMQYKHTREAKRAGAGAGASGSLMDPDFIPDLLLGAAGAANPKGFGVATDARGMPMVGRNSKNPNVVRRTGNRKKKRSNI